MCGTQLYNILMEGFASKVIRPSQENDLKLSKVE